MGQFSSQRRRCVRGRVSLAWSIAMHHDTVLRLLLRNRSVFLAQLVSLVRDINTAEDLFQDVSVLVLQKCQDLQDETHFRRWMHRTLKHKALSACDKQQKVVPLDAAVLELLDKRWEQQQNAPAAMASLRHCLETLTPRTRRLLRLRYVENLTGERLAALVGQKVNSVYVALSRAHQALRECIRRRQLSTE